MSNFSHFIFGFAIGFIGVIPPGLLNLTAAKISVKQDRRAAIIFASGASLVVIAQVYIGVFFSKLLSDNPDVLLMVERFAIIIFLGLSVFFFIRARLDSKPELTAVQKSDYKLFGQGIILSALNIFPIPFYIGFSSFLASRGAFTFKFPMAHLFIAGATIGTFLMLCAYINYVKRFGFDNATFARKINYLLAIMTIAIATFTFIRIN
jgi:threonine/homoserine/homoserine lactone efflux protein